MLLFHSSHSQNHIELVIINKEPLFYSYHEGPFIPTMRVLLCGNSVF